jgi:hypothetical protein
VIRKLASTIALGGSIALSFLPTVSLAAPPVAYERIYYAEPEYTTAVGGMYRPCPAPGAMVTTWGTSSPYYTEEIFPCEE